MISSGNGTRANTCLGFGRAELIAFFVVIELTSYPDGTRIQVDIGQGERGKFGPAQAGENRMYEERHAYAI